MKYPNRIIKVGEGNTAIVKAIQKKIIELNIGNLQGTGVYAVKTKNALKLFQATQQISMATLLKLMVMLVH